MPVVHTDRASLVAPASAAPRVRGRLRHPAFFGGMSLLLLVIVFLGFAPTYYLRPAEAGPIPGYLRVHGAAMTAWFLVLLGQVALIATRQRGMHRRMGWLGAAIALIVAVLNPLEEGFRKAGRTLKMGKACLRFTSIDELPAAVIAEAIRSIPPDRYIEAYEASRTARRTGRTRGAGRG